MRDLVDMHCHILPGVDDGAVDIKMAVKMLMEEEKNGVTKVILTPHYHRRLFDTSMQAKRKQFEKLKNAVNHFEINVEVYFGCEYHAGRHMISRID
ncbi:CpsB/CapC family capsule biosynthesis tyrosine phosphatase, partial [Ohessyouella blattaphilus]